MLTLMIKKSKEDTDRVVAKQISPILLIAKEIVKFAKKLSKPLKYK